MAEIFYGADADLARLQGLTVAVIGYGIQGRAQALNVRDSGVKNVAEGSVRDESWKQAEKRLREALGTAYGEEESGA
jgi:ketol-acid reductoisomerase